MPSKQLEANKSNILTIESGRSEKNYWLDLWHFRELAGFLTWRDIKVRYKQAAIGVAWVVLQPLIQTVLLTLVFSKLAKMPDGGLPYPMIVISGLLPWQFFSSAFSASSNSLIGNSNLISKVYFPRLILPISTVLVSLFDFIIIQALALVLSAYYGVPMSWRLVILPLFVLHTIVISLGAGFWITALTVKYRDFRFITPFIVQVGVFVTPIGFRSDVFPGWRSLLSLNPLTSVVDGFRWCMLGGNTAVDLQGLIISISISVILMVSGIWYFRRTESSLADII